MRPRIERGAVDASALERIDRGFVLGSLDVSRTALLVLENAHGERRTKLVEPPARLAALSTHLRSSGTRFTAYLQIDVPETRAIVERFEPEARHLRAGSRLSWSPAMLASGIGCHADDFDSVLVQLRGGRCWRLWEPTRVSRGYRDQLRTGTPMGPFVEPGPPDEEWQLAAGDALWVPSPWAHAGHAIGDGDSIALAIGFARPTVEFFLRQLFDTVPWSEVSARIPDDVLWTRIAEPVTTIEQVRSALAPLCTVNEERLHAIFSRVGPA